MAQTPGLLTTKLVIPPLRRNLVARPRLRERLELGLAGRLTLIAAPAGFGKTTLVVEWCASDRGRALPVAWVSLEAADRDPTRFWRYLVAATSGLGPGVGELARSLLASPQPPAIEGVLTALVNDLAEIPTDAVLVLDDYHLVDSPAIHAGMAFLLDHLPPRIHLVLTTRADPTLPLARLRGRGELVEIRAADLRCSAAETRELLNGTIGLGIADAEAAALEARTEGWMAGLQLAGLALRDQADQAGFIAAFTGSHRFVVDYLAEEVMQRQPGDVRDFLRKTSILERMCGPLCDAILDGPPDGQSGQEMLEALERANLFVVALDHERRWYRYHHLFADVLRAHLAASPPADQTPALHRRASDWLASHGYLDEAVEHAVASGDFDHAASLIERAVLDGQLPTLAEQRTVERWIARLPDDVVRRRRILAFCRASWLISADPAGAEAWLDDSERAAVANGEDTPNFRGEIAWARSLIAGLRGDADRALAEGQLALASLHPKNGIGRLNAALGLGVAHTGRRELQQAEEVMAGATALGRAVGSEYFACLAASNRAYIQRLAGSLRAATATCREALAWSAQRGPRGRADEGMLLLTLADLLREQNGLDEALACAAEAVERCRPWASRDFLATSLLVLARVHQARGDLDRALEQCAELKQLGSTLSWIGTIASAFETQLRLRHGDPPSVISSAAGGERSAAITSAAPHGRPADDPQLRARPRFLTYAWEHVWIAPVQCLLAEGRAAGDPAPSQQALIELEALEPDAAWLAGLRIATLALRALAHHALDDEPAALAALQQALSLAEPEGYVRLFADQGPPMAELLRLARARDMSTRYVDRLLTAMTGRPDTPTAPMSHIPPAAGRSPTLPEPLTGRELEVLQLIAAGQSNAQIARSLVVAASTVKTHVNNVFGKLGVNSRTQALARARDLNLL